MKLRTVTQYFERFSVLECPERYETAKLLQTWNLGPEWLDIGCGPVLPCWIPFATNVESAYGIDVSTECIQFAENQLAQFYYGKPLEDSLHVAEALQISGYGPGPNNESIEKIYSKIQGYYAADILRTGTGAAELKRQWASKWNLVTQFGVFVCLDSKEEFRSAVRLTGRLLKPGGRFLGAAWLSQEWNGDYVWNGRASALLESAEMESIVTDCGFKMLSFSEMKLSSDSPRKYDRFVLWAAELPG